MTAFTYKRQEIMSPKRARSRRFFVAALVVSAAMALLASGVTHSSEARFIAYSSNPGAALTGGSMTVVNSKDGSAVITATALAPGTAASGSLTLTNQGDLAAAVTLANSGTIDTPSSPALSQALTLKIEDITGTAQTLYNGTMSGFSSLTLTQFAANATRTYRFTIAFPTASATPGLQGASTSMTLRFSGVAK